MSAATLNTVTGIVLKCRYRKYDEIQFQTYEDGDGYGVEIGAYNTVGGEVRSCQIVLNDDDMRDLRDFLDDNLKAIEKALVVEAICGSCSGNGCSLCGGLGTVMVKRGEL